MYNLTRRNTFKTFSVYSNMNNLSYADHLKNLVKNAEERIVSWKELLADCHKSKIDLEWYKEMLRDGKNRDETWLKNLREELTNFNQGLNPPSFYTKYK